MSNLDNLEQKAKVATPGPFGVERRDDDCGYMNHIVHGGKGDYAWCRDELDPRAKENAAFIAAANPQTVLAMVEVIRAAEEMRSWYSKQMTGDEEVSGPASRFDAALATLEAKT